VFIEKPAGSQPQDYFRKRLSTLISRVGARGNPLRDDGCTIHLDGPALSVVGRGDRWTVLVGEMGELPQEAEAPLLRRFLSANLRPAGGPLCALALDEKRGQMVVWCQADLRAIDDAELYKVFERFAARLVNIAQAAAQQAVTPRFSGPNFRPGIRRG